MRPRVASPVHALKRWILSRSALARQASERGDTLVEVLLALIILSVAGVALLAGFATAISSSAEHRNLASQDSSERTAANVAIADIQQQAGQSNDPFSCPNGQPDGFTPSFSNLTGHFQVTITSVSYWNGSGWQSGCVAGAAQQYTLTISNASAGWSTTETTVISDPGLLLRPPRSELHPSWPGSSSQRPVRPTRRCRLSLKWPSRTARATS